MYKSPSVGKTFKIDYVAQNFRFQVERVPPLNFRHAFHSVPFSVFLTLLTHWPAKEHGIAQNRCGNKYLVTWVALYTFS